MASTVCIYLWASRQTNVDKLQDLRTTYIYTRVCARRTRGATKKIASHDRGRRGRAVRHSTVTSWGHLECRRTNGSERSEFPDNSIVEQKTVPSTMGCISWAVFSFLATAGPSQATERVCQQLFGSTMQFWGLLSPELGLQVRMLDEINLDVLQQGWACFCRSRLLRWRHLYWTWGYQLRWGSKWTIYRQNT